MARSKKKLAPVHPGEALQEIMKEAGLTADRLAPDLRVPANRIAAMLEGSTPSRRGVRTGAPMQSGGGQLPRTDGEAVYALPSFTIWMIACM
jgi:hypothetical protein